MSDNIIKRDGNLVEVDFNKKPKPRINLQMKDSDPLTTAAVTAIVAPALMISAAIPFIGGNIHNNISLDGSKSSNERRLTDLPEHMRLPESPLIRKFKENPQEPDFTSRIKQSDDPIQR